MQKYVNKQVNCVVRQSILVRVNNKVFTLSKLNFQSLLHFAALKIVPCEGQTFAAVLDPLLEISTPLDSSHSSNLILDSILQGCNIWEGLPTQLSLEKRKQKKSHKETDRGNR